MSIIAIKSIQRQKWYQLGIIGRIVFVQSCMQMQKTLSYAHFIIKFNWTLHNIRCQNIPDVLIHIVCNYADMIHERNTLISKAYPLLRAYCRERYGLEFQAVDMRWGVQSGARDDHSSADLCIEEIHSSQKLSVGPNFVVSSIVIPFDCVIILQTFFFSVRFFDFFLCE